MGSLFRRCLSLVALLAAWQITSACQAQTYKVGESIEVLYLGSWLPATVIKTNPRGEVLAEYTFATRPHQDVFKPDAVRAEYESGAIARGRTWSDPTGSFKIKAALLRMNDDKLLLRKTDKTELEVPIDKLSEGDKTYLKKLQQSMGLAGQQGPEPPPVESFGSSPNFGSWTSFGSASGRPALTPDPLPAYLKLKQAGCGFPAEDFFDEICAVLPVGGPEQWLLVGVENSKPLRAFTTRLFWVSLAKQKIEKRQLLPPSEKLLDYHAPSRRALTMNDPKDGTSGPSTLTVWEMTPKDDKVKPIVRWYAGSSRWHVNHPWGRLIDGNLVLHRDEKQRYVVWDIAAKQAKYETAQESFFAPDVVLSGGHKYLFIPEDQGVRVLEAATGNWVTNLPMTDGCSGVAVSEDGRMAAALGRSTLNVWDLTKADEPPTVYQAEAIGTPFSASLAWVGNDRLMAGARHGQDLFSLKNKLTLWHYEFDHSAVSEAWGGRVREIVDRHLVYAATSPAHDILAVGAVQLPGPRVDEMETRLDREQLYCLKPGTPVQIEVQAGEYADRVTKALEAKVRDNGWVASPVSPIKIVAEMKRGESQTVNYRFFRIGQGESTQSATIVPYISSLNIKLGDESAWYSGSGSGAPPVIRLKEGQTAQDEVDKWQKPRPEFFETVKIPARILDPKYRNGLGATRVTNRGLIPKN